jgi:hypothetical protein
MPAMGMYTARMRERKTRTRMEEVEDIGEEKNTISVH